MTHLLIILALTASVIILHIMFDTKHKAMITLIKSWFFSKTKEQLFREDMADTIKQIEKAETAPEIIVIEENVITWYNTVGPAYQSYYFNLIDHLRQAKHRVWVKTQERLGNKTV
jgi:hypothetical protein